MEEDYLFGLKQEDQFYQNFQQKMNECDVEIEKLLKEQINNDNEKKQYFIDKNVYKKINKNTPKNLDINLLPYQYFAGVDLLAIEGVSHATALAVTSEVENGFRKFGTAD